MKFIKYWIPVILWAGIIFTLSSIPNLESGLEQDFIFRKVAHVLEYAILAFLLIRAFGVKNKKSIIIAAGIALLYAVSDEYHQTFVFGREGSWKDVGINLVGIMLTSILCYTKCRKPKGR